jgi:hypothetical protein
MANGTGVTMHACTSDKPILLYHYFITSRSLQELHNNFSPHGIAVLVLVVSY